MRVNIETGVFCNPHPVREGPTSPPPPLDYAWNLGKPQKKLFLSDPATKKRTFFKALKTKYPQKNVTTNPDGGGADKP